MSYYHSTGTGYIVKIQAVPGASATKITGLHGDRLKIRVAAPPERGAANDALLAFLARSLDLPKSQVHLKSGARDRAKVVEILNLDPDLGERLEALLNLA